MGTRKTDGLSRDSAYEGAGLAAPLVYCVTIVQECVKQFGTPWELA